MDNFNDKYKKKNPFTVPEGYFEGLTDQIMDKLEKKETVAKPKFIHIIKPYLGLAAIFVLALLIVQALFPLVVDKGQMLKKEQTEQTAYVPEGIEEDIFDSQFNPTNDEIIEYLATEVNDYELMYAGNY